MDNTAIKSPAELAATKIVVSQIQIIKDLNIDVHDRDDYKRVQKSVTGMMMKDNVPSRYYKQILRDIENEFAL